MNKDKQIEEMARRICNCYYNGNCKLDGKPCDLECGSAMNAYEIYNAGYRKASEVAREIVNDAKEILLDYHLQENKKYLKSLSKTKKQFDIETARYRAITDTIKFAIETLNEIEKKYTEGNDG